jgi:hypothetical protein
MLFPLSQLAEYLFYGNGKDVQISSIQLALFFVVQLFNEFQLKSIGENPTTRGAKPIFYGRVFPQLLDTEMNSSVQ